MRCSWMTSMEQNTLQMQRLYVALEKEECILDPEQLVRYGVQIIDKLKLLGANKSDKDFFRTQFEQAEAELRDSWAGARAHDETYRGRIACMGLIAFYSAKSAKPGTLD